MSDYFPKLIHDYGLSRPPPSNPLKRLHFFVTNQFYCIFALQNNTTQKDLTSALAKLDIGEMAKNASTKVLSKRPNNFIGRERATCGASITP